MSASCIRLLVWLLAIAMPLRVHSYPARHKRYRRGGFEPPRKSGDAGVSEPSHESRSLERTACSARVAKEENWHTTEIQECEELGGILFMTNPTRPTGSGNTNDPLELSFPKLKKVRSVGVLSVGTGSIAKLEFPELTEVKTVFLIRAEAKLGELSIPKLRTVGSTCTAHRAGVLNAPVELWEKMMNPKLAQAKMAVQELKRTLEAQTQALLDVFDS